MTRHLARSLFVGRLNFRTLEMDLRYHFEQCGTVEACEIARDSTGKSKGFGFVVFSRPQDAEFAVQKLEESSLDGKKIHVEFNKPVLRKRMMAKQEEREARRVNQDSRVVKEEEEGGGSVAGYDRYLPEADTREEREPCLNRGSDVDEKEELLIDRGREVGDSEGGSDSSSSDRGDGHRHSRHRRSYSRSRSSHHHQRHHHHHRR
jgi:RNA recognition motif-containing protein